MSQLIAFCFFQGSITAIHYDLASSKTVYKKKRRKAQKYRPLLNAYEKRNRKKKEKE